jgi:flagellar motility protein MotE (MotC chaperone)
MKRIIKIAGIVLITLLVIGIAVTGLTYFKLIRLPWLEESFVFSLLPGAATEEPSSGPAGQSDLPITLPVDENGALLPVDPLLQELLDEYQRLAQENAALQEGHQDLQRQAGQEREDSALKDELLAEWAVREQTWLESEMLYQQQIDLLTEQLITQDETANNRLREERAQAYKNLADYYTQMNTQKAADLVAELTNDEAIGVLGQMDQETAAAVIERLPKEKATSISKQMLLVTP